MAGLAFNLAMPLASRAASRTRTTNTSFSAAALQRFGVPSSPTCSLAQQS